MAGQGRKGKRAGLTKQKPLVEKAATTKKPAAEKNPTAERKKPRQKLIFAHSIRSNHFGQLSFLFLTRGYVCLFYSEKEGGIGEEEEGERSDASQPLPNWGSNPQPFGVQDNTTTK